MLYQKKKKGNGFVRICFLCISVAFS